MFFKNYSLAEIPQLLIRLKKTKSKFFMGNPSADRNVINEQSTPTNLALSWLVRMKNCKTSEERGYEFDFSLMVIL